MAKEWLERHDAIGRFKQQGLQNNCSTGCPQSFSTAVGCGAQKLKHLTPFICLDLRILKQERSPHGAQMSLSAFFWTCSLLWQPQWEKHLAQVH